MPQLTKLFGPPGCGKTHKLLSLMEEHMAAGVRPQNIAFISFTKKAAKEAKTRAMARFGVSEDKLPFVRTIHSLVFKQLGMRRESVMQWRHYRELGAALGLRFEGRTMTETGEMYGMGKADRIMFIEGLARAKKAPLLDVWRSANEPDINYGELERFSRALALFKKHRALTDFNEMLKNFQPHHAPRLDVLILDEAQDLTPLQWDVFRAIAPTAARIYVAGDDDQCSVQGTKVLTTSGEVAVEDLDPAVHRLVCYDRNASALVGMKAGYSFKIQKNEHHGPVITVRAAGRETTTTINHKWIVKWTTAAKQSGACVTYLMRKGTRWRVGWCQLFRADGCCHLGVRAHQEKAEEAWILGVHRNRTAASVQESVIAAKFGMPTIPFEPVNGANHMTAEAIDAVFEGVGETGSRAHSCLYSFNRNPRLPIWSAHVARTRRAGSQIFEADAENLLDGMMEVPVPSGGKHITWETIHIERTVRHCFTYGLDVERHHNYVADGIVTHNCIYSWAGADVNEFLNLPGEVQVLDQSYRVPAAVHKTALTLSGAIRNRQPKTWKSRDEAGSINWHMSAEDVDMGSGNWLLLARNGYMLAALEDMCMRQGLSFTSVGKSPLDSPALKAIISWEKLRKGQGVTATEMTTLKRYTGRTIGADPLPPWFEGLDRMDRAESEYFRAARRRGESLTKKPRIEISTIHAAKGGEADNVLMMTDVSNKSYEQYVTNPDDEYRVMYVGVTRTRQNLHLITPKTLNAFPI